MSIRKIKKRVLWKLRIQLDRKARRWRYEMELWEWSPPVGMEFGSPEFDELEREADERLRLRQRPIE